MITRQVIRLVALDLDGTLLTSQNTVSPATHAAIIQAVARGVHVTIATGRRLYAARAVAETLGLSLPLILHGGAVIQESATGAVRYEDVIPPDTTRMVLDMLLAHGHQPVLYESPAHGGRLFAGPREADNGPTHSYLEDRGGRAVADNLMRLAHTALAEQTHLLSIAAFDDDEAAMLRLHDALAVALGGRVALLIERPVTATTTVPSHGIEIFNAGVGKGKALAHLADLLGVLLSETMAVGDYDNDLSMLDAVRRAGGVAVAMANAVPLIKGAATAFVASNDADGVAEAFARFVEPGGDE